MEFASLSCKGAHTGYALSCVTQDSETGRVSLTWIASYSDRHSFIMIYQPWLNSQYTPKYSPNLTENNFKTFEKDSAANLSVLYKPLDSTRITDGIDISRLGLAYRYIYIYYVQIYIYIYFGNSQKLSFLLGIQSLSYYSLSSQIRCIGIWADPWIKNIVIISFYFIFCSRDL